MDTLKHGALGARVVRHVIMDSRQGHVYVFLHLWWCALQRRSERDRGLHREALSWYLFFYQIYQFHYRLYTFFLKVRERI